MSITVTGIPFLLISVIAPAALDAINSIDRSFATDIIEESMNTKSKLSYSCEEVSELEEKSFPTQIADKKTLIKTLSEYGAAVTEEEGYELTAQIEGFRMKFNKAVPSEPYTVNIRYSPEDSPNNLIDDITEEYSKNVQEISYNKIKERLEEKNLQINEEEILDDDTIVLTVNLE